jgi:hypothetical protein
MDCGGMGWENDFSAKTNRSVNNNIFFIPDGFRKLNNSATWFLVMRNYSGQKRQGPIAVDLFAQ